jgi:hypothetical protein
MATDSSRFSRNVALFGTAGQARIASSRVAIVGLGGLGSHVAQQLAYIGVPYIVLIDPDIVTTSSLNRLVGANPSDADSSADKVAVMERLCRQIRPECDIRALTTKVSDVESRLAVESCTSVFGCLDDDTARLELIKLCACNGLPLFDLASDTGGTNDDHWYGGRVLFSGQGDRCPSCMDLLDQTQLARASMSDDAREVDRRIYGVKADDLDATGPAVVSINGIVASLAVTEWMVWTTGLRDPAPLLEYRGRVGAVFVNRDLPQPDCYYCSLWNRNRDVPKAG